MKMPEKKVLPDYLILPAWARQSGKGKELYEMFKSSKSDRVAIERAVSFSERTELIQKAIERLK
jgi:hypothetical protein